MQIIRSELTRTDTQVGITRQEIDITDTQILKTSELEMTDSPLVTTSLN